MSIYKFNNFIKSIYEINLAGTYLEPSKTKTNQLNREETKAKKKYGKVFAQAPKSSGKRWGLDFKHLGGSDKSGDYQVIFPSDFVKNFKDLLRDFEKIADANKNVTGFISPANKKYQTTDRRNREFKNVIMPPGFEHLYKIYKVFNPDLDKIDFNKLSNIRIQIGYGDEEKYNRIHFPSGIPDDFKQIGMGYIIYEEFIKHLGFASSKNNASSDAKPTWSKITNDPDFLSMVSVQDESTGGVFVVVKDRVKEFENIIKNWVDDCKQNENITRIVVSEELKDKLPEIDFEIKRSPFAKKFKEIRTTYLGFDIDQVDSVIGDLSEEIISVINSVDDEDYGVEFFDEIKKLISEFKSNNEGAFRKNKFGNIEWGSQFIDLMTLGSMNDKFFDMVEKKNYLTEEEIEYVKFLSILRIPFSYKNNEEKLKSLFEEKSSMLKNDISKFTNPKLKDLILYIFPIENIIDIYIHHKEAGENVESWDKVISSYLNFVVREDSQDLDKALDFIQKYKPDLKNYEKITLNQKEGKDYAGRLTREATEKLSIVDKFRLFDKETFEDIFIGQMGYYSEDNLIEQIESQKFDIKGLLNDKEFLTRVVNEIRTYWRESKFLSYLIRNEIIKLSEVISLEIEENTKFDIALRFFMEILKENNPKKLESFIQFLRSEKIDWNGRFIDSDFFDSLRELDWNELQKIIDGQLFDIEKIVQSFKSKDISNNNLVKHILTNYKSKIDNRLYNKLLEITDDGGLKKTINIHLSQNIKSLDDRIGYFMRNYPDDDNIEDLWNWMKNVGEDVDDFERLGNGLFFALFFMKDKDKSLKSLDTKKIKDLTEFLKELTEERDELPLTKDLDLPPNLSEFKSTKNIKEFYTALLSYIETPTLKKLIQDYLADKSNESRIMRYSSFLNRRIKSW
jgi:hypothetical protein